MVSTPTGVASLLLLLLLNCLIPILLGTRSSCSSVVTSLEACCTLQTVQVGPRLAIMHSGTWQTV
jgi:hypothetical protein